jgi:GWxTD domain-containing protein
MSASTFTSGKVRTFRRVFPAALLLLALHGCSAARMRIERDPFYESFFEKARLIMTREEVEIYKHLPDREARAEFIDEFWKKRDPVPETPENENKIEFERRIAYANRWFKENRPMGRGWDTPRGRILLQLGEPDNRYQSTMLNNPSVKGYERWIYYYYRLELIFVDSDGFGEFKLRNWPAELLTAINLAQFTLDLNDRKELQKRFSFDADYKEGQFAITIPMQKIRFREEGDSIRADYRITVYVYRNYREVDRPVFSKQLQFAKDAIPGDKKLTFFLPYSLAQKGKYFFDVIVEDVTSGARSRSFAKYKR